MGPVQTPILRVRQVSFIWPLRRAMRRFLNFSPLPLALSCPLRPPPPSLPSRCPLSFVSLSFKHTHTPTHTHRRRPATRHWDTHEQMAGNLATEGPQWPVGGRQAHKQIREALGCSGRNQSVARTHRNRGTGSTKVRGRVQGSESFGSLDMPACLTCECVLETVDICSHGHIMPWFSA